MKAMGGAVRILYFAWVRERIGAAEEEITLPEGIARLDAFVAWLRRRSDRHEAAFAGPGVVRAAVNQVFARDGTPVQAGDEVAFFPPVTGG